MGRSDVQEGQLLVFRGDGRTGFRLVKTRVTREETWLSHYESGDRPRRGEVGSALVHMALSMFSSSEQAMKVNERFRRRLGSFVASVELNGDFGVWFAETGAEGHLAVWGRPSDLQRSVVAVEAVVGLS